MGLMLNRVNDLIGEVTSFDAEDNSYRAAIYEVTDSLKPELLMKYSPAPAILDSTTVEWDSPSDSKILDVIRKDSNGIGRVAMSVPLSMYESVNDDTSIYSSTAFSPVYTIEILSLKVSPLPTDTEVCNIYYYDYNTTAVLETDQSILNFPESATQAVVLKTAINILANKMSDSIQDEEDNEISIMIQGQIGQLYELFKAEISRLGGGSSE